MSPEFPGIPCVAAGIGTHEVVAGHLGSGRTAAEAREAGAGNLVHCHRNKLYVIPSDQRYSGVMIHKFV